MWNTEIIEGQPPRCQAMTGLPADQVRELVGAVFDLLGGVWQPVPGRPRVPGLRQAVVLTLFLMRRNEAQAVAGKLFGCSQSSVSRVARRLRPLLRQATAELAGQVRRQAKRSAVLVDGFLAPTGVPDLCSGKRHTSGLNVQAVSDLAGRLVDVGLPVPGARHDSKALTESRIADRWANHLKPGGPGMLADLGRRSRVQRHRLHALPASGRHRGGRKRAYDLGRRIVERAQAEGSLRPDVTAEDLAFIVWAHSRVTEATYGIDPNAWRRYLALPSTACARPPRIRCPPPALRPRQVLRVQLHLGRRLR